MIVVVTLLLAACGKPGSKPEDNFVGQYDGEMDLSQGMINILKSWASTDGEGGS
ncbi:MAG: hypothetical protein IH945_11120 [Armatimonadetes bacterium]|nr:hypothetical protein [Armatimonadota bacterium]